MTGVSTWAQTDVTSTYITDADFSSTTNWTDYSSSGFHDIDKGLIGTYGVRTNEGQAVSTVDATHLATEYCFGFECRWSSNFASYNQTKSSASLPAGVYTITFDVENTNSGSEAHTWDNLFYVMVGDTKYADESTEWMAAGSTSWTTHTISFTIEEAITADFMISLGYGTGSNNIGSAKTPTLHVSHLLMTCAPFIQPTALTLSASSLDMKLTQTTTLSVSAYTPANANYKTDITWSTNAPGVATVSDDGVVTAVATGSATITATAENGVSTTCPVTVTDVTPVAAPAYYSEIAEGDFYIVNAATGKYLGGANSWGTQASQIEHGIPFTVAVSDGKYTLDSHTYNNEAEHFINGTYVDKPSTNLYVTSLGSGKYAISTADGSAFITANVNNTTVANTAANSSSPLAQWYFVSKANRDALFTSATNAAPADATYYLTEANISRNLRKAYNTKAWTGDYSYGGKNENQCAERYCATTDVYQTVSVPNGKYTVKCQGFYRRQSGESTSYLYANGSEVALNRIEFGGVNSMDGASEAFTNGEYWNTLPVYVTDGSLKVGIKCEAITNWTIWDNFTIAYHGPTVGGEATEIPMNTSTDMTAGKWYYFDIPVDGLYNLTTTTLSDIVYTNDANVLIENESSVTATFGQAVNETLTAGRYFVKSASAQSLELSVGAYAYNVGAATLSAADGAYNQSSTFTVTFPAAATSDPAGTTALVAESKATVNGAEVALAAVANGFSIDLGTLTENTDYAIVIPAGVYGYAGESMNEAINVTLHTPAVFDGEYVLYDATSKLFLGRGAGYGTEAVADKYGVPVNLTTDATGASNVQFIDNNAYLFIAPNGVFTDGGVFAWTVNSATDGYTLSGIFNEATKYLTHAAGGFGEYVTTTDAAASATVWTLKTLAERDAIVAAYSTDNINNVITASGVATTADAFATFLSDNYNAVDCTSAVGTATFAGAVGDWTWAGYWRNQDGQPAYGTGFVEAWNATGAWSQTIGKDNLPAGIYKVTVQGYERRCANTAAETLKSNGYNLVSTFLSANGEQVRFIDWNDVAGKPTDTNGAVTAFTNGEAVNEVYVYLDGNTDLSLMIRKPNYIWDCWVIWNNVTLTRYEKAEATMVIGDAKYGTFVAPFDVTIPSGVKAYTVDGVEGNTLTLTEKVTKIPANTPVVLESETAKNETFYGKTVAGDPKAGLLTGTYEEIRAAEGTYILQNQGGKVGFYQVDYSELSDEENEAGKPKVKPNRAYLTAPAGGEVKAFYLGGGEDAIKSVFEGVAAGEVYDLSGRKVSKLQRGVNIVNGKKVIVK